MYPLYCQVYRPCCRIPLINGVVVVKKTILLVLFLCLASLNAFAVPVAPNESVVKGTVVEYGSTSPASRSGKQAAGLYKLVLKVESTEDIPDMLNFLADKKGQKIEFWSKERFDAVFVGKKIKAVVEYRGDERGGGFWIKKIEILKQ